MGSFECWSKGEGRIWDRSCLAHRVAVPEREGDTHRGLSLDEVGTWKIIFSVLLEMLCGGNGQIVGVQKVPIAEMLDFVIFSWTSVKESSVSLRRQKYHWQESQLPGHFSLSFFFPFGRHCTTV